MSNKYKILIVEDETDLQQAYSMILSSQGYTVITADNGMDGRELLRNLDIKLYPEMKVVAYSNLSDKAMEEEMVALGAHRVILKSRSGPTDLINLVQDALKS